jgi:hypothetical protein
MKDTWRNVNNLAARHCLTLRSETHLALPFDDEVNLLLFLVMPRNLPALRVQGDVTHAEVLALNGRNSADEVLRATPRGITSALNFA